VPVVVSGLVQRYGRTEALRGVDLLAPAGRLTALLGPNGAGKTSLVECVVGLREPHSGTVTVAGLPAADRRLRARVGVMLQDGGLPAATPAGAVLPHLAAMYAHPWDVADLTDRLGIGAFRRTPVRRLSGGQRQRLALAAALVGRPEVVVLDEPTAGLDPQARLAVLDLVDDLRHAGTTILLTTHLIDEAERLADHVVVLDAGRVLVAGATADLVGDRTGLRLTVRAPEGPASAAVRGEPALDALAADLEAHLRVGRSGGEAGHGLGCRVLAAGGHLEVRAEPTPALVHAITGWALARSLAVVSLVAGRRSLQDVVLDLTGRELR
jgi:ABC-2 type transport system ATP-binding protein